MHHCNKTLKPVFAPESQARPWLVFCSTDYWSVSHQCETKSGQAKTCNVINKHIYTNIDLM